MDRESRSGLAILQRLAEEQSLLLKDQFLSDRLVHRLSFSSRRRSETISIALSYEFLSDLSETPGYGPAAELFTASLAKRFVHPTPMGFICKSGPVIRFSTDGLVSRTDQREICSISVDILDMRRDNYKAIVNVLISSYQNDHDLTGNELLRYGAVLNTVRKAIDDGTVRLLKGPAEPVPVKLRPRELEQPTDRKSLEEFLRSKVYWLGFNEGTKDTQVWIADPWDADYLHVSVKTLVQTAQVLDAKGILSLVGQNGEFAKVGLELLRNAPEINEGGTAATGSDRDCGPPDWDLFICYASKDKREFVAELARGLKSAGLLKLGDSLRQCIDKGLVSSRFGVVILSHAFFERAWPQSELDGLFAREVKGHKVILPVWHGLNEAEVQKYSPILAGRLAVRSEEGLAAVVERILEVVRE